jgi:hypothetical protein
MTPVSERHGARGRDCRTALCDRRGARFSSAHSVLPTLWPTRRLQRSRSSLSIYTLALSNPDAVVSQCYTQMFDVPLAGTARA